MPYELEDLGPASQLEDPNLEDLGPATSTDPQEVFEESKKTFETASQTGMRLDKLEGLVKFHQSTQPYGMYIPDSESVKIANKVIARTGKQLYNKFISEPLKGDVFKEDQDQWATMMAQKKADEMIATGKYEAEEVTKSYWDEYGKAAKERRERLTAVRFPVGAPENPLEVGADIGVGIVDFVVKVGLLRKAGVPENAAWETVNLQNGGQPGMGLMMQALFGGLSRIPAENVIGGEAGKTIGEAGAMYVVTRLGGGSKIESAINAGIPIAFKGVNLITGEKVPEPPMRKAEELKKPVITHVETPTTPPEAKTTERPYETTVDAIRREIDQLLEFSKTPAGVKNLEQVAGRLEELDVEYEALKGLEQKTTPELRKMAIDRFGPIGKWRTELELDVPHTRAGYMRMLRGEDIDLARANKILETEDMRIEQKPEGGYKLFIPTQPSKIKMTIGKIMTGDIRAWSKLISRFPGKIKDTKSLEEVGNQIADHLGIPRPEQWEFAEKTGFEDTPIEDPTSYASNTGSVIEYDVPSKLIKLYVGKEPLPVTKQIQGMLKKLGMVRKIGDLVYPSQGLLKRIVVHELIHSTKEGYQGHPPEFYIRFDKDVKELFDVKKTPIAEEPTQLAPGEMKTSKVPPAAYNVREFETLQQAINYSEMIQHPEKAPPFEKPLTPEQATARFVEGLPKLPETPAETPATEAKTPTPEQPASPIVSAVKKLTDQIVKTLKLQKKARAQKEAAYTREKKKRVNQFVAFRDKLIEEQGMDIATATARASAAFKGQLLEDEMLIPKELLPDLSGSEWEILQGAALSKFPHPGVAFQQLRARNALEKIKTGEILQDNEIALMADIFGPELARALQKQQPFADRAIRVMYGIGGFFKSAVGGGDVSYSFRQIYPVLFHSPTIWAKTVGKVFSSYISKEVKYKEYQEEVRSSRYYDEAIDHRLPITEMGEFAPQSKLEERFPSKYAEIIPLMRRGNRAAVVAGNSARMMLYEKIRKQWDSKGYDVTDARLDKLSDLIADLTGRANIPRGRAVQALSNFLNIVAFSPKLAISRAKNIATLFHSISTDPLIRAEGFKTLTGFVVATSSLALVAAMYGYDVEINPLSADFLKARKGNRRYDLLAGHGQIIRFLARYASGHTKTAADRVEETNRKDVLVQFARSKEAPILNFISELYSGRTFTGEPVEGIGGWTRETINSFTYLWLQDGIDAFRDSFEWNNILPALGAGTEATLASWVGVGTQTYPQPAHIQQDLLEDELSRQRFGKVWKDLGPREQQRLKRENKKLLLEAQTKTDIERTKMKSYDYLSRLVEQEKEAGRKIHDSLSTNARKAIDEVGIDLGLSRKSGDWIMNDKYFETYQKLAQDYLEKGLSRVALQKNWQTLPPDRKKERVSAIIETAKDRARSTVLRQANKNSFRGEEWNPTNVTTDITP